MASSTNFLNLFLNSKDKNSGNEEVATEKFKVIGEAYSVLKDK